MIKQIKSVSLKRALLEEVLLHWPLMLLLCLSFFSALYLQHVRYTIREATKHAGELRTKLETLEIEASHLLLEEQFLLNTARLQDIAEHQLGMRFAGTEPKEIGLPYFSLE